MLDQSYFKRLLLHLLGIKSIIGLPAVNGSNAPYSRVSRLYLLLIQGSTECLMSCPADTAFEAPTSSVRM